MLAEQKVSDWIRRVDMQESKIARLEQALRDAQRENGEYQSKIVLMRQQIDESPIWNRTAAIETNIKQADQEIFKVDVQLGRIAKQLLEKQESFYPGLIQQENALFEIKRQWQKLTAQQQAKMAEAEQRQKRFETQYNELMQTLKIDPYADQESALRQKLEDFAKQGKKNEGADDATESEVQERVAQLKKDIEQFEAHFKECQDENARLYQQQVVQLKNKVEEMRKDKLAADKQHADRVNKLQLENDELRLKRDDLKEQCQLYKQQVESMNALMPQIRDSSIARNKELRTQLKKLNERQDEDFAWVKRTLQKVEEERYQLTMVVQRHEREQAQRKESVALEQRKISGNLAEIALELQNIFKDAAKDFKPAQLDDGAQSWFVIEQDIYALARFVARRLGSALEDADTKGRRIAEQDGQIGELRQKADELQAENEALKDKDLEQTELLNSQRDLAQSRQKESQDQKTLDDLTVEDINAIKQEQQELHDKLDEIPKIKDMVEQTQQMLQTQTQQGQTRHGNLADSFANRSGRPSRAGSCRNSGVQDPARQFQNGPASGRSSMDFADASGVLEQRARRSVQFPDNEIEADTPLADAKAATAAGGWGARRSGRNEREGQDRRYSKDRRDYDAGDQEDGFQQRQAQVQPVADARQLYATGGKQRGPRATQTDDPGLEYAGTQIDTGELDQGGDFRDGDQYNQQRGQRRSDAAQQLGGWTGSRNYETASQRASRECRPPIDDKIRRIIQEKKPLTSQRLGTLRRRQE